jgi:hypothetical protein
MLVALGDARPLQHPRHTAGLPTLTLAGDRPAAFDGHAQAFALTQAAYLDYGGHGVCFASLRAGYSIAQNRRGESDCPVWESNVF